jgi:hypothetical protein
MIVFARPTGARVALGALLLAATMVPGTAFALQCPAPEDTARPGVIVETPAQIAQLRSDLSSGDASNHLHEIIYGLRQRHPGVGNGEITNYLMTAYCPVVAGMSGLGEAEKQARMAQFDSQIDRMVFANAGDSAVPPAQQAGAAAVRSNAP